MNESQHKEACINMWRWLSINAGKTKDDYRIHLCDIDSDEKYSACHACDWAAKVQEKDKGTTRLNSLTCIYCPITWNDNPEMNKCTHHENSYERWIHYTAKYQSNFRCGRDQPSGLRRKIKQYAKQLLTEVQTTWKIKEK